MSIFQVYKPGQGKYTRIVTLVAVLAIALIGAFQLSKLLISYVSPFVAFGVPTLVVIGMALLVSWLVNRPRTSDFLIATESEMKKVSWSSRKEVVGSTKVVIITTLILAAILYAVDILFVIAFRGLGIMG